MRHGVTRSLTTAADVRYIGMLQSRSFVNPRRVGTQDCTRRSRQAVFLVAVPLLHDSAQKSKRLETARRGLYKILALSLLLVYIVKRQTGNISLLCLCFSRSAKTPQRRRADV